jgi:hypothetical protein
VGLADRERSAGVDDAGGGAQQQAVEASARSGFAARAVLYSVVGLIVV